MLDESVAARATGDDDYGQNKLLAERAVQELAAKRSVDVILRPTRIYGPFSQTFTVRPLQAIAEGPAS